MKVCERFDRVGLDEPGRRVSTVLSSSYQARMFAGLQRMSSERGLHAFTAEATSVNHAEWARIDAERGVREGPKHTVQPTYRSKADKEIESRGASWKADVRMRMSVARRLSTTEEEFFRQCAALGLKVTPATSKRNRGEYIYQHPSGGSRRVCGARLGYDWSARGIRRRLERDVRDGVKKPDAEGLALIDALVEGLSRDGHMPLEVIGFTNDRSITARDVGNLIDVCERMDVRSLDDFADVLRNEPLAPATRASVRRAMEVSRSLGYVPLHRQRSDGRRMSFSERAAAVPSAAGAGEFDMPQDTASHEPAAAATEPAERREPELVR